MTLADRILSRSARVGVMGLGYVGLPLAVEIAQAGFPLVGMEKDGEKVKRIREGQSYIEDVPQHLLADLVKQGRLEATADPGIIAQLDVVIICVPTPLSKTKEPDISSIVEASQTIAPHLAGGEKLVILESTTFPTTTEEVTLPILEAGGLKVGKDFFLAFSPERIDPGNRRYGVRNVPKVVGGVTPRCTELAHLFYGQFVEQVVPVSSPRAAEMTKLLENIFRCVNIALINELAMLCDRMKIDIWEVIEAASSKPFGFMPFYPGPGLGGHCIPVDPFYLSWKAKEYDFHTQFIELAGNINENMPYWVVGKVAEALNTHQKSVNGSRILLLGVAYKRDVADVRNSPALRIAELLRERGAQICYSDPFIPRFRVGEEVYTRALLSDELLGQSDCVVIITDHGGVDYAKVAEGAKLVVDTRGVLHHLPK
ncbi:MAG: nucleotide sugar dehydrogenase [Chloroflexi bacterium]|nr:nucleotide sugar dehydrogenase [Chloroflexota bacterium]